MVVFNMFMFCSNEQVSKLMQWGEKKGYVTTLLVWHKYNSLPFANCVWWSDTEFIIHIREKSATFQGNSDLKSKVFRHPIVKSRWGHPTEKPIQLISRYIRIGSNEGDTILDPFMGSGTTGVAALRLNRKFIGIEINNEYFKSAKERIEIEQRQESLF